ncbi:hypothetical protein ACOT81_17365 [Streptomyces sp. WI04-05B]|uniref:hypothetical protein n=1 Tax=Streptomyces TaxID=1883 RepID=UPI0029B3E853|nr:MULTISPECIES: hypothetical protein [unclassified Streptomyces]MDX2543769.1 hypothetical protein [Streptomyces sp. WI04-05B]MDX2582141.1 hypothetical protein [Streptomyces sp. WI04-05A]
MHETSAAPTNARWPLAAAAETDWLRELAADDGLTGFMPPPLPDAAWVLHAMYEHELGPFDMSYDEYRRAFLNRNATSPEIIPGLDPADVFTDIPNTFTKRTGEHPGPRYRRLRWAELSLRTGDPVAPEGVPPCHRSFPSLRESGGWPVGIATPSEGSLDRADWNRLVEILTEHSPQGPDTRCLAYYTPLGQGAEDFDNLHVRAGRLTDAKALYDHPEEQFWTPSNLWAHDRSWVLCTDYDLWATKVAGPAPLVEALLNDSEIEAVRLRLCSQ